MADDRTPLPPNAQREHWHMQNEIKATRIASNVRFIVGIVVAIIVAVVIAHITLRDNNIAECKRNVQLKHELIYLFPTMKKRIEQTIPPEGCAKAFPKPIPFLK